MPNSEIMKNEADFSSTYIFFNVSRRRVFFSSRLVRPVHAQTTPLFVVSLYISRLGSGCIDSTLIFMTHDCGTKLCRTFLFPRGISRQDNNRENYDRDKPGETMRCPYVTYFVRRVQFD